MFFDEILSESFQGSHSFAYQQVLVAFGECKIQLLHVCYCYTTWDAKPFQQFPAVPDDMCVQLTFWQAGHKGNTQYELSPGIQVSNSNCMNLQFRLTCILLENFQGLRSVACQNKHVWIWSLQYSCDMIPCLKQVSNYACAIYLIRLHSWTCQTKTCQYMILDVLRLHFVNWVLENQISSFCKCKA